LFGAANGAVTKVRGRKAKSPAAVQKIELKAALTVLRC
jgi:hypothetical protein